jgi:lysophospholipase L1-like esterase
VSNYGLRNATASASGDLPYIDSQEYAQSLKSNPDVVILMLGTNDSKTQNWDAQEYEQGLKKLVAGYQELSSKPIVYLMRSPYCYSVKEDDIAEYNIQPDIVAGEIADIIAAVASETGVEVIDLYTPTEGKEQLYTDGIHFNADGYKLIANEVFDKVK